MREMCVLVQDSGTIQKGAPVWKKTDTLIYDKSIKSYKGNDFTITYKDNNYYLNDVKLTTEYLIAKEVCGKFCYHYEYFYRLDIENKRKVCRNVSYLDEKWREVRRVYSNSKLFFESKSIDLLLSEDDYKTKVDLFVEQYLKNRK